MDEKVIIVSYSSTYPISKSRQTNKIAYNNISIIPYTLIATLPRIVPLISSCTLRLNLAQARPIYHSTIYPDTRGTRHR